MTTSPGNRERGRRAWGQGLVEFAILVPAFMIVLFGMLEFGFAFSHHLTLEYATREGARIGAALGNGTIDVPCQQGVPEEEVDELIIAAVQRVITSPGSQVPPERVTSVRIYRATASGAEPGGASDTNFWVPGVGQIVDGTALKFVPVSQPWKACDREKFLTVAGGSVDPPDSIGVAVYYDYHAITPLGTLLRIGGAGPLRISDRTVMALNPFQDP